MKNSLIKVLSFVMALTMIVGCFTAISFSADEHTHTKGDVIHTVDATCESIGYTVYDCTGCDEDIVEDVKPATGVHTPENVDAAPATCDKYATAAGQECTVCGTVISGCGQVSGSKALGHDWKAEKIPATCGSKEYTEYTCLVCNKTAQALFEEYEELIEKNKWYDADVYEDVKAHNKANSTNDESQALTHDWGYAVKTAPTTCVDGVTVATCKNCKTVKEYAIKATHQYAAIEHADYPCVDGVAKTAGGVAKACKICGAFDANTKAKDKVEHKYDPKYLVGDTITAGEMSATFQAHGLKVGDSLNTEATCYAGGKYFGECKCGAQKVVDTPADATKHTKAWSWYVGSAKVNSEEVVEKVAAKKCTEVVKKVYACTDTTNCNAVFETVVVVEAGSHDMKTKVQAPTCTAEGYSYKWCSKCGEFGTEANPTKYDYVATPGHQWGNAVVTGSCDTILVSTKTCSVCNTTDSVEQKKNGAHEIIRGEAYVVKKNPTCGAKGFYAYDCADCDYYEVISGLGEWGAKDANAHPAANLTVQGVKTAPTCTAKGVSIFKCTLCNVTGIEKEVNAKGHRYGEVGQSYTKSNRVEVDASAKAATCQAGGQNAGQVCLDCGAKHPTNPPTATEKNPNNHTGSKVVVKSYPATCLTDGYDYCYTSCCGYVNVPTGDTASASKHDWETKNWTRPSCETEGYHQHKVCKTCGTVDLSALNFTTCDAACKAKYDHTALEASKDYKLPALGGHDFEISDANKATYVVAEKPEKCGPVSEDDDGTGRKAHIKCENDCGAILVDNQVVVENTETPVSEITAALLIRVHGVTYVKTVTNKAATCTDKGIDLNELSAEAKATMTEVTYEADGTTIKSAKFCTKCYSDYETDKLGHEFERDGYQGPVKKYDKDTTGADCTAASYYLYTCGDCGVSYADSYTVGNAAHNWNPVADDDATENDRKCIEGERTAYKCVNCDQYRYDIKKAPIAHQVKISGVTFDVDLGCLKIGEFDGMTCEICSKKIVADATKATENDLTVEHNKATASVERTCTQDGYSVEYCVDCKQNLTDPKYEKAWGHTLENYEAHSEYIVKKVDAKDTTDGYVTYVCAKCDEEITLTIPATKGLTLNVKAEANTAVSNGQVKVQISASATDYVFNAIHFELDINPTQVKLADVDAVKIDYAFAAIDAVTAVATDNGDYISVLVYVPNGADGKAKNVSVTGTDVAFITLTLDVLATANGDEFIKEDKAELVEVLYIDTNGAEKNKENVTINVTTANTIVLGNVNGDDKLDAGDSIAIQTAIYNGTYVAGADFDKNGVVDLADHVAFVKFITSKKSVVDYLAAMGITIESIVADMTFVYDIDGDRAAGTDNDKAVFATTAKALLSDIGYAEFAEEASGSIEDSLEMLALMIASGQFGD